MYRLESCIINLQATLDDNPLPPFTVLYHILLTCICVLLTNVIRGTHGAILHGKVCFDINPTQKPLYTILLSFISTVIAIVL